MKRMLAAELAILHEFQSVRVIFLVFLGVIIPLLALRARERNFDSCIIGHPSAPPVILICVPPSARDLRDPQSRVALPSIFSLFPSSLSPFRIPFGEPSVVVFAVRKEKALLQRYWHYTTYFLSCQYFFQFFYINVKGLSRPRVLKKSATFLTPVDFFSSAGRRRRFAAVNHTKFLQKKGKNEKDRGKIPGSCPGFCGGCKKPSFFTAPPLQKLSRIRYLRAAGCITKILCLLCKQRYCQQKF